MAVGYAEANGRKVRGGDWIGKQIRIVGGGGGGRKQ